MALRSFAAALALRSAILSAYAMPKDAQPLDITLKWPNDVLVSGGKVAGILLESSPRGALPCLAIGFGVNLLHAPDASAVEPSATPATSLQVQTGQTLAPQTFLTHLAAAYALREAQISAHGFAPIRADFLAHAARLGTQITARLANGTEHTGRYETIDADGNLILITHVGRMVIPAADVFF
jgi:BirA family biotin operon repressor/biotin-[acetyl-CoA-carboxylase] ligase